MKKLLLALILLLLPASTFAAFAVPWNATSTTGNIISPVLVNGVYQIASSSNIIDSGVSGCSGSNALATDSRGKVVCAPVATGGGSTTTYIWVDVNRVDAYTPDGSIFRPYKSIGAAIQSIPATYEIAPGVYQETPSLTFTATSTIEGNQATILDWSGTVGASPAGTISFSTGVILDNFNLVFGNINFNDRALSDPSTLQNSFVNGNVNAYGLSIMNGGQLQGGVLYTGIGSLTNFSGVNILDQIQAAGIFNLNNSNSSTTLAGTYNIVASTTGSQILLSGVSIENSGAGGGGVLCANGASVTMPNVLSSLTFNLATTTASGVVNCGSAATTLGSYVAIGGTGRIYVTPTNLVPFSFAGLNVEGTSLFGVNGGNTGIAATTSPAALLSISGTAGGTTPFLLISTSTSGFATSTAFQIDRNGNVSLLNGGSLTISGQSGCAQFSSGLLGSTGSNCGSGSGVGTVSTSSPETSGQLPYWTTTSGYPAKLSSVATTTLTTSGVLSLSQPIVVIGGSASILTLTGGSAGQVLGWLNGIPTWTASSSVAAGTGISIAVNGAATTVTNSSPLSGLVANYPFAFSNPTLTWLGLSSTTNSGIAQGNVYIGSGGIMLTSASSSIFGYTPLNPTRNINTTWPITGGGDLSADRTIAYAGFGTTSDTGVGNNQVLYTNNGGIVKGVATSSPTFNGGLTTSGTAGSWVGGSSYVVSLANVNANSLLGCVGSAACTPTSVATTSIFSGTVGQSIYFSATNTLTATSTLNFSTAGNIGIGTTSPYAKLSIAGNGLVVTDQYNTPNFILNTASTTGPIFSVQATTSPFSTLFSEDQYGHLTASSTGATPTISCAPSGGTIGVGSNDASGDFTTGTLSTSCTLTFAHAYSTTPEVLVGGGLTSGLTRSTTAVTFTLSAAVTGDTISYLIVMP